MKSCTWCDHSCEQSLWVHSHSPILHFTKQNLEILSKFDLGYFWSQSDKIITLCFDSPFASEWQADLQTWGPVTVLCLIPPTIPDEFNFWQNSPLFAKFPSQIHIKLTWTHFESQGLLGLRNFLLNLLWASVSLISTSIAIAPQGIIRPYLVWVKNWP